MEGRRGERSKWEEGGEGKLRGEVFVIGRFGIGEEEMRMRRRRRLSIKLSRLYFLSRSYGLSTQSASNSQGSQGPCGLQDSTMSQSRWCLLRKL